MARMRTLKPEFWTDEVIVELSFAARLLYMGTWNFALCEQGHLDDSAKALKLKILPADNVDAVELIEELITAGRLVRKQTSDGKSYLQIPTLPSHSKADTRWSSRCGYCAAEGIVRPLGAPPSSPNPTETQESFPELSEPQEKGPSKGREGKVKELKESARKRATRIPDDFAVTTEMATWGRDNAPHVDGKQETRKFINYWKAKSGQGATKLDWRATWENWILRAAEFGPARASPSAPEHTPGYLQPLVD